MSTSKYDWSWLTDLTSPVATPKYFQFLPLNAEKRAELESMRGTFPDDYVEFLSEYGECKLFRNSSEIGVWVELPRAESMDRLGRRVVCFGRSRNTLAFFTCGDSENQRILGLQTWTVVGFRNTDLTFYEWFKKACERSRKDLLVKDWKALVAGPPPFTDEEKSIVEARRHFRWQVESVSDDAVVAIRVHNGSSRRLSYLSIGVRVDGDRQDFFFGSAETRMYLKVHKVLPGETRVIDRNVKMGKGKGKYSFFEVPEPGPEDRDYWEFRPLNEDWTDL